MKRDRLAQAIRNNSRRDWYRISNEATEKPVQVLIYGEIGDSWWGDSVPASQFVRDLAQIDDDAPIDFHIHSPGGDVFDGLAIATAIRTHPGTTTVYVDGLAASAASYIAIAADEVVMARGAELMVHDAWGFAMGNAADMAKMAADLGHVSDNIASLYAAKAGGTAQDWRDVMLAETWYSADEAVTAGLADRVDGTKPIDEKARNAFDLSIFAHAGRAAAPPPALRATHKPPATPAEPTTTSTEGADMTSDNFLSSVRERLGVSAEVDEDAILAALDETLAEQAENPTSPSAPPGTVLIDEGTLQELQASAALGVQAHQRQAEADREAAIQNAVDTGRISASRAGHWRAALTADPGAVETLNALPENTIPVVAKGYTGGVDEASDDDVYAKAWPTATTGKDA